jgi:hypothetical protein
MASSEDLLKISSKSLSEIGGHEEAQRPAYTYAPVMDAYAAAVEREPRAPAVIALPAATQPIPVSRALVPVSAKPETYERWRHFCLDWVGWLSGRAVA